MSTIVLNKAQFIKALLIGVASGVIALVILMCLLTISCLTIPKMPYEALEYIMLAIDTASVFIGSFVAARILRHGGIIIGLSVGAILYLAVLIAGFSGSGDSVSLLTPIRALLMLLFGAFGGIVGVNRKEKLKI